MAAELNFGRNNLSIPSGFVTVQLKIYAGRIVQNQTFITHHKKKYINNLHERENESP